MFGRGGFFSARYSYYRIVDWKPNDHICKGRAVQDWLGRVLQASEANSTSPYCTDDIPILGLPLLSSLELLASRPSPTSFQITGTFYPVCPFDECTLGSLLSYTEKAIRNLWLKACYPSETLWLGLLCPKVYKIHFQFSCRKQRALTHINDQLS